MISVVIPAYNASDCLEDCLQALADQSLDKEEYEVIVVDDGSTDDTAEKAEKLGAKVIQQDNQGPAAARNLGVKNSSGEYVLFTDADCVPDRQWVEEMSAPLRENPQIHGVKGVYRTRQKKMTARFAQIEFEDRYKRMSKRRYIDFVDSHAAAFRRDTFDKMGGFNPNFPVANNEDVELSYKLADAGCKMIFNPKAAVYHKHPESIGDYLFTKFLRAYWRIIVYKKFPGKIISDSYTPQILKLQILLAGLFVLSLIPLLVDWKFSLVPGIILALFLTSTTKFVLFALKHDKKAAAAAPLMLFLRSAVFAFGSFAGILSQKRRDVLIPALLLTADLAGLLISFFTAFWIRTEALAGLLAPFDHTLAIYLAQMPFIILFWLLVFSSRGLYRERRTISSAWESLETTKAVSQVFLVVISVSFFLKWDFSRSLIILFWLCSIIFVNFFRYLINNLHRKMLTKGYNSIRILIYGCGETGKMIASQLNNHLEVGYKVVGMIDDDEAEETQLNGIPFLGTKDRLDSIIKKERIDEILIVKPDLTPEDTFNLVTRHEKEGVRFRVVSDLFGIMTRGADVDKIFDLPFIELREERLSRLKFFVKTLLDYILAIPLVLLLSPVIAVLSLLVYTYFGTPIFNRQLMVGRYGKLFRLFRFRTQLKNNGQNSPKNQKAARFGHFMEKSGLDELPQIFNVLRGEMSLVGPRPEFPEIVSRYDDWQKKRLDVKPGIAGLWQLYGPRGLPLHENLLYDFYYIKNRSLLMDLTILLKSIPKIARGFFTKR